MATNDTTFGADGSYEIRADDSTNTLYLTFNGSLPREQMVTAADETLAAATELDDGFAIINDVSTFSPPSPEAAEPIEAAQRELATLGVDSVVRVVSDETGEEARDTFQRQPHQAEYDGETATTVEAAERYLGR